METTTKRVKLRLHHVICVLGFQGKGYSPAFVENFWQVVKKLGDENTQIELVEGADSICAPCPNNDQGTCRPQGRLDEPRIRKLDNAYEKTLNLKPNTILSWGEAKKTIALTVTDQAFEENCAPCGWKKLGYCKSALQKLRAESNASQTTLNTFSATLVSALTLASLLALPLLSTFATHASAAPVLANAAQAATPPANKEPAPSAEDVEQRLISDKSQRMTVFLRIQQYLDKHNYLAALKELRTLQHNVEYADYYHYLSGQAEFGKAKKLIRAKSYQPAIIAGEKAGFHFTQVEVANPYTTLKNKATLLLGETELELASVFSRLGSRVKSRATYEKGFQRLSQANRMGFITREKVRDYAKLCARVEKQKKESLESQICRSWGIKLGSLLERDEQNKLFGHYMDVKLPSYVEKSAAARYKVELDIQAFQQGFYYYLDGKFEDAFKTWRDLLENYPKTSIKLRTKFWMGRAAQKSKHDVQAETLFREVIQELPFSFYALLSSWFGNIDISRMMDAEMPAAIYEAPVLSPSDAVHIRRAEKLIASGVPELAQNELVDIKARPNMSNEFLVYLSVLNHMAENHLAVFQIFSELSNRGYLGLFSSYGQKLLFPTTYLPLIRKLSKESGVDPLLILSIIKQESAFNSEAASIANAFGLMQIIPPTARDLESGVEVGELIIPQKSIKLGARYVAQLLKKFQNNYILTLAAYNAGPSNSERWRREAPLNLPPEEFIEWIGFRETHDYVQNILRNYYWYNKRLRGETFVSLNSLLQYQHTENIARAPQALPKNASRKISASD